MNSTKTILLIHGLWLTPRCWENFQGFYEKLGYHVIAPSWPRMKGEVEDLRRDPSALAGLGLVEIADHYEAIIRKLEEPPIIMGHSMGGGIVQILLDRNLGAAGVCLAGVPAKGVLRLPIQALIASSPVLLNPANLKRTVALTFEQFRYSFANVMPEPEARKAYERYAIPGPGRPVFQVAFANLTPHAATTVDRHNGNRAPLLLVAGSQDHTAPAGFSKANQARYRRASSAITDYKEFANRSHLLMAQHGWEEVAEFGLSWAAKNQKYQKARPVQVAF